MKKANQIFSNQLFLSHHAKKAFSKLLKAFEIQNGVPKGIRTPVAAVKGRCPGPG